MHRTLEQHRIFPYLAWGAIITLAAGTTYLVLVLREDTRRLHTERVHIERAMTGDLRYDPIEY